MNKPDGHITTYTKVQFCPLHPHITDIEVRDIAHALSLMTRANGHFPRFYSVGQHSVDCAKEAIAEGLDRETILGCLLHDGSISVRHYQTCQTIPAAIWGYGKENAGYYL